MCTRCRLSYRYRVVGRKCPPQSPSIHQRKQPISSFLPQDRSSSPPAASMPPRSSRSALCRACAGRSSSAPVHRVLDAALATCPSHAAPRKPPNRHLLVDPDLETHGAVLLSPSDERCDRDFVPLRQLGSRPLALSREPALGISHIPKSKNLPSEGRMNARNMLDGVGHSGPLASPRPCQTRSAPMITAQPTYATVRIRSTSRPDHTIASGPDYRGRRHDESPPPDRRSDATSRRSFGEGEGTDASRHNGGQA
jgi:hypothetical protein